jgi:hypothetical protein
VRAVIAETAVSRAERMMRKTEIAGPLQGRVSSVTFVLVVVILITLFLRKSYLKTVNVFEDLPICEIYEYRDLYDE